MEKFSSLNTEKKVKRIVTIIILAAIVLSAIGVAIAPIWL